MSSKTPTPVRRVLPAVLTPRRIHHAPCVAAKVKAALDGQVLFPDGSGTVRVEFSRHATVTVNQHGRDFTKGLDFSALPVPMPLPCVLPTAADP